MKLIKCEVCQSILGEKLKNGIAIKKENHKELLVEGIIKIICENGHTNLVSDGTSGENTKPLVVNEDTVKGAD